MHKVSDGQRRRVQIAMGLLRPFKVSPQPQGQPSEAGAPAGGHPLVHPVRRHIDPWDG